MAACYIFDIDGTLADLSHRLHHIQKEPKDWDAFFAGCPDDAPLGHVCQLAADLMANGRRLVFVSGRSDAVREDTIRWLRKHTGVGLVALYMRAAGDHRPDNKVKIELLEKIRADGWEPIMAFEDRTQVVDMWRANGVPCAQVAPGDF